MANPKKPKFPSKTCPKCGTLIHVRSKSHPACGWVMGEAASVVAPGVTRRGRPAKQKPAAGGISIEEIAAVKRLVDRMGAEKVRRLAQVLEQAMAFNRKQRDMIQQLADSPHDCLLCGGRASLTVSTRDLDRVENTGRVDLRCAKCGIKITISA